MQSLQENLPDDINPDYLTEFDNKEPKFKDVTIDDIINLKLTHPKLTLQDAGKLLNCTKSNICYHLNREGMTWNGIIEDTEHYKQNRADILAFKGYQCLKYLTSDKIKNSTGYQLVGMNGVLYSNERLERDKSTSNISVHELQETIITSDQARQEALARKEAAEARKAELQAMLEAQGEKP